MVISKKKPLKNRILLIGLMVLTIVFQGCYILEQGLGQYDLRFKQIPIDEAIANESNLYYRKLLTAVPEIKTYALQTLRLKNNNNYTGYFFTPKRGIAFVVTACRKDKLEPYTWWFPIVGSVPYKGFFNEKDALELENELKEDGFDTWIFAAPAYSSLGWFKDPITTPMLKRGYYNLAETIIHEMTHSTVYVEGEGDFNEQLASFVAKKGAIQYFRETGNLSRDELEQIRIKQLKSLKFSRTVREYIKVLENLYKKSQSLEETLRDREIVFSDLIDEIVLIYPDISKEHWKFNNARILQYNRYQSETVLFQEFWRKSGKNWVQFWKLIEGYVENQG